MPSTLKSLLRAPLGALLLLLPLLCPAAGIDPGAAVDAFHKALHDKQADAALGLLAADVSIYQQGFQLGREQYKSDPLQADIAFAGVTSYEVLDRKILWLGDNAACVTTRSRSRGTFSGEAVDLINTETMVLRRAGDGWIVVHIHWSAHPADQGGP